MPFNIRTVLRIDGTGYYFLFMAPVSHYFDVTDTDCSGLPVPVLPGLDLRFYPVLASLTRFLTGGYSLLLITKNNDLF